jgi:osmotically-inducible protein OsmY
MLYLCAFCIALCGCQVRHAVSQPVEERGMKGFAKDSAILLSAKKALFHHKFKNVKAMVHQGTILLCGFVDNNVAKEVASMVTESIKGVQKVINEIDIHPQQKRSRFKDTFLSQKAQSSLFLDARIASRNYHITVLIVTLYIIGTAQSIAEKQWVMSHMDQVSGVNRLVAHIFIKKDNQNNTH